MPGLEDRSRDLQQDVEEQDRASEDGDGGWFGDMMDWLGDTAGDAVDAIGDGMDWLGDRVSDGADWVGDRIGEGLDWLGDRVQDGKDLVSTAIDAVRDFEWPRVTELLVDGATGLIRGTGDGIEALTGIDLKLADDGTGYADAPVPVTGEESGLVPPSDLSQIIANTNTTYGDKETGEVSMSVVGNPPTGVIVNIPGTEKWGPGAGDNPMDLTGNAEQAGSGGWSAGSQATADAIARLYADNDIPPGTPLMLNGHSQGGMVASSLAANEDFAAQYNLTNVMTYGSPVDNYSVPSSVNQLNLQHGGDAVPRIDLGGLALGPGGGGSDGATNLTLDSPGAHPFDFGTNHSGAEYQNSVQTQPQDPNSTLSQYSQDPSLAPFLTGDPGNVQHYRSGVHREN
ncbi:hypothetical protein [Brachybacterium sp. GPGPB12]|uniref:hypothetical protein n=1 Tax=Brachybacterium sp. GPGPB12 TaxID=3023517 RepID=UPI00313428FB